MGATRNLSRTLRRVLAVAAAVTVVGATAALSIVAGTAQAAVTSTRRPSAAPTTTAPPARAAANLATTARTRVIFTSAGAGRIEAAASTRSALAERIERGELPTGPKGTLFTVGRVGDPNRFVANMLSEDFVRLAARPGWDIRTTGEDVSWTPARCGAMPNALVGTRWLTQFDVLTDATQASPAQTRGGSPENPAEAAQNTVRLTLYDLQTGQFRELLAPASTDYPFSATLASHGPKELSYLWASGRVAGGPDGGTWTTLTRRTIDAQTLRFRDEPITLPKGYRAQGAFRWRGTSLVDLININSAGKSTVGELARATNDKWELSIKKNAQLAVSSVDGYNVRVNYSPNTATLADDFDLLIDEATGKVVYRFSHDRFGGVSVLRVLHGKIYLSYLRAQTSSSPTARDLAVVDLRTGRLDTAFADTANPRAATVTSQGVVLGEGAELFIAGVQDPSSPQPSTRATAGATQ